MKRIKCPCCGFFTQLVEYEGEPLFEICEVCYWQYDEVAHDKPDTMKGANHVTLNEARKNFKIHGVCEEKFVHKVRPPLEEELPENNE